MSEKPTVNDPTYRDQDIKIPLLIVALCAITVVIILAFIGMNALFKSQEKSFKENQVLISERLADRRLPSDNILQVNEKQDYQAYYKMKMAYLKESEVLDEQKGIARIPIEEAKAYVLNRGLMPLKTEGMENNPPAEDLPSPVVHGQGGDAQEGESH